VLPLCLRQCDPLAQDCAVGSGCYAVGDAFICVPTYDPAAAGETCPYLNGCLPGLVCIDGSFLTTCAEASFCCTSLCDLAADPATVCAAGDECLPWFAPGLAPRGYEDVGVCAAGGGP